MAQYEIRLAKDDGTEIAVLEKARNFRYGMVANAVGGCALVLPGDFDQRLLAPDNRICIWRAPDGGRLAEERQYFLRYLADVTAEDGQRQLLVQGLDANYLLDGPIVAYAAGTPYARKTDYADDLLKAIVRENRSSLATDTDRQLSSTFFTVEADLSLGPTLTGVTFPHEKLLNVLQKVAKAAKEAGTAVYFDVVAVDGTRFEFRTYAGQLGLDHTYPDGLNPVLMGAEYGSLSAASLVQDWTQERTVVYAGGRGDGLAREIVEVEDAGRSGRSLWGRREAWVDARNAIDTGDLTAKANARLEEGRPRIRFAGAVVDSPQARYGQHWRWGDLVTGVYQGQQYACLIGTVDVTVNKEGLETLDATLEYWE